MTQYSQNGWIASQDKNAIGIVDLSYRGVDFPNGVKRGDVFTIFYYLVTQYHKTVEPLIDPGCWGYFYKQIEGSTTLSNHSSGTAIDINAPLHPMGKRGTFSATKVAAIRVILKYLEGVVRWGGDYTTRPDEMHWEINANSTAVARVAAKIRNATMTTNPPATTADQTLAKVHAVYTAVFYGGSSCGTPVPEQYRVSPDSNGNALVDKLNYLQALLEGKATPTT